MKMAFPALLFMKDQSLRLARPPTAPPPMGGEKLPVRNALSKSIYEPDVANYLDVRISRARRANLGLQIKASQESCPPQPENEDGLDCQSVSLFPFLTKLCGWLMRDASVPFEEKRLIQ